ncbi:MAG: hypothetical protein QOE59_1652 [Actinomycetota bacterium]|nr:hypothetical protein [Actinomycetota bacterium]
MRTLVAMTNAPWTGMVPIDDTAIAVTDTGGPAVPVVYLNGSYASQRHWRRTIAQLGSGRRHITFDERARGGSRRSSDYSFEACLRDLDAVLEARGIDRPILVGWSYGAYLGVFWADRHPGRVSAVVSVDGALPYGLTDDEGQRRIRVLFGRMRLLLPIAAPFGLAARMSAGQHAEVNIEINEIAASCGPVLDRVRCPVRYVLAAGDALGSRNGEHDDARAALEPHLVANSCLRVSGKVTSNHSSILRKDARAVARAVHEAAAAAPWLAR